ncbi:hypothetical protein CSA37_05270 [Candidatus Fermentibacteria bacterium]|nr:MAG: hypothetical protein CSA37_05270 [Candidatus Fermentibacteria bacterium]
MRSREVLVWAGLLLAFFGGRLTTTDVAAQYQVAESVFGSRPLFTSQYGWQVSGVREDNYVPHAPGYSLILLPSAGVGLLLGVSSGKVLAALTNAFMSLLLIEGMRKLAEGFIGQVSASRFLAVMAGTMALVYGRMPYDVTSAAALAIWGSWFIHSGKPFHAGVLFGAALLVRPDIIVLLPVYWTCEKPMEKFMPFIAGAAPFVMGLMLYNHYRFGSVLNDGHGADPAISPDLYGRGIPGLLFSPGKGLFWYAPLTVLAIFYCGDWRFWSPLVFSLVLHGFLHDWTGGTGWGPRFLFPVLPVFFMPLMRRGTGGKLFTVLAVLTLIITFAACVTDTNGLERELGQDDFDSQSRQSLIWKPSRSPLLHTLTFPDITSPDLLGGHVLGWPGILLQLAAGGALVFFGWKKGECSL